MKNKKRLSIAILLFVMALIIAIGLAFLLEYVPMSLPLYIVLVVVLLAIMFFASHYLGHVVRTTGVYVCPSCGHVFIPSSKDFWFTVQLFDKRKLTCPKCQNKGLCGKDYTKSIEELNK